MTNVEFSNTGDNSRTIVFYDGGCGLCSKEIRHYAHLDRRRQIEWIDFCQDQTLLNALGVTSDQAMRRLHVLDRDGVLRDGVPAFVAIWAELPYYRALSRLVRLFKMVPLLESAYRPFSAWRYKRRMLSVCAVPTTGRISGPLG